MDCPQATTSAEQSPRASAGWLRNSDLGPRPRTIVIVGAGFSGTIVAINLLRLADQRPLRVVLVDRAQAAGGVAYARRPYPYLLNVPAGRMSATSSDPLEFLAFAQRSLPHSSSDDFLPRALYGEYLESSLALAELASSHAQLERIRGSVIAIERPHRSAVLQVYLADGRSLSADTVVLALGNPPPAPLPGAAALRDSPRYVADPWNAPPAFRAGETVLIAGTGLTMADIVLAGNEAAKGKAVIHAISRHGLVPLPQTSFRQIHAERDGRSLVQPDSLSIRHLVRTLRALSESAALRDGDWREVIGLLRSHAPAIWQRLAVGERRRFLRHARCYWDVHRHRLPESTWAAINALRRTCKLHVHAGRIGALEPAGHRIRVRWRARGEDCPRTLLVDRVINCTGADYDVRHTQDRLLRSLIAQGMAVPDPLGVGLVTAECGALVDARGGRVVGDIYYMGPMLRAAHWETTAVQELRVHAEQLACHLVSSSRNARTRGSLTQRAPPPASNCSPVSQWESSEARNTAIDAMSSG
jgi:uncharacterized NAD(P)/FAD-binding protein YdhS